MPRHQAGELQGLPLPDGVDPLGVPLLFHVAGVARVDDADGGRRCGTEEGQRERERERESRAAS